MIFVQKVFLLLVLLLYSQFCFAEAEKSHLYSQSTESGSLWIPNTVFVNGERVIQIENKLFAPGYSGVVVYGNATEDFHIIPLPTEDAVISSLETIGDKIWIVTRRHGVFVLNPSDERIVKQFFVHKNTDSTTNANLYSVLDSKTGFIWFSSYLNLDVFDLSRSNWVNLTDQFEKNGIGKPSSQHRILIDSDAVWVSGGAHVGSVGAILKCGLNANACISYSQQLISEMKRTRIDPHDLFASDKYVWTIYSGGNLFNSYIAEFDKATRQWIVYGRDKFLTPIKHVAEAWPDIKVTGSFDLFWFLEHFINSAKYQDKTATPEEKMAIDRAIENVEAGLKILNQLDDMSDFKACARAWRFGIGTCNERIVTSGKNRRILYATKTPLSFNTILACQKDAALVATSSGIGVVEFESLSIKWVAAPKDFGTNYIDILTAETPSGVIIKRTWEEGDYDIPPDYSFFDFKSAELKKISATSEVLPWHSLRKTPITECSLSNGKVARITKRGVFVQ